MHHIIPLLGNKDMTKLKDWKMLRRYTHQKPEHLSKLRVTTHVDEAEYMRKLAAR